MSLKDNLQCLVIEPSPKPLPCPVVEPSRLLSRLTHDMNPLQAWQFHSTCFDVVKPAMALAEVNFQLHAVGMQFQYLQRGDLVAEFVFAIRV